MTDPVVCDLLAYLAQSAQSSEERGSATDETFSESDPGPLLAFGLWALKSSIIEDSHFVSPARSGITGYLQCLFPARQHFVITPRLSVRALDQTVQHEGASGVGSGIYTPGFAVVKYVFAAGASYAVQQPLVLWETMRQAKKPAPCTGRIHFEEYMQRLATHPPLNADIWKVIGVLQVGSLIELYRFEMVDDQLVVNLVANMDIRDPEHPIGRTDELTSRLLRCARDNWAIEESTQ